MSDESPIFRSGEESLRWAYVVRARASATDSVHLRSSSCSMEFIFETADSLMDSLVVQDVPVGYARGVSPLSHGARYSRAPGVGVKVDTAGTIDVGGCYLGTVPLARSNERLRLSGGEHSIGLNVWQHQ
jgi:hypothetical protein